MCRPSRQTLENCSFALRPDRKNIAVGHGLGARHMSRHCIALFKQVEDCIVDQVNFSTQRIERGDEGCNDRVKVVHHYRLAALDPRAEAERLILDVQKRCRHPVGMPADKVH